MSEPKKCVVVVIDTISGGKLHARLFGRDYGPTVAIAIAGIPGERDKLNESLARALIARTHNLCERCWTLTAIDESGKAFVFTEEGSE